MKVHLIIIPFFALSLMACKEERIRKVKITESTCDRIISSLGCEDSSLFKLTIKGSAKGTSLYILESNEPPDSVILDCGVWSKEDDYHCFRENNQPNKIEFEYIAYLRCIPENAFFGTLDFDFRSSLPSSWFGTGSDFENKVSVSCR
ncbi:hypothetical protein [Marinoscillum pacificum]|uniref:hypothetical protein n=1 Tax=Marinoscillum pacificum TaxID=392723 RepID=UPI002157500F|nr:hypothetical protein [Marinoscillum pacificum]